MPIMDGFEATQLIRELDNYTHLPIIALTASTFLSKKRLALKAGMTDFLSKPFTPDQLHEVIEKYLTRPTEEVQQKKVFHFTEKLDAVYLKEAYGNDVDYALDMFQTYIDIIEDDMILIKDNLNTNDLNALKKQLHKIKPTFTMVGIGEITKLIETLEPEMESISNTELNRWFMDFEESINSTTPIILEEIKRIVSWQKS